MTSYTAFLWVFVQTVSGKRASDTFVKLIVCDFIGDVKSQNVFIFLEQQICFVSCRNY